MTKRSALEKGYSAQNACNRQKRISKFLTTITKQFKMSPRTSLLSTRKALSIVLRQPSVSPAQTSNNTLNATRLSSNPGVSIGLVPSGKTQRRFNSSKPDSKDRSDQKEAERHPTAEKGAELEEGIRRSEGIAGTPEEVHGSPISEVSL